MLISLLINQKRNQQTADTNCIHFYTDAGTDDITISVATPGWDGSIFYSTDGSNWTTTNWDGTAVTAKEIYFRGLNNTVITGNMTASYFWTISCNSKVKCTGNMEALRGYDGNIPTMGAMCYAGMFHNCTSLTAAPALPATTLASNCYMYMFYGCASLTTAHDLPATTLASSCCMNMFGNCTSLTTAPALPATTLVEDCYYGMFVSCTSLTTAPTLPATTLASSCYLFMFYGCTALTTAPALPATTLVDWGYRGMFQGCTSLTTAPSLPATTLAAHCYQGMFEGCSSLKISATYGSPYVVSAYNFPTTSASFWGDDMFKDTGGTFKGTPTSGTQYYSVNQLV